MWLRLGKWIELGVHFGSPNRRGQAPDGNLIHAAVRFGTSQWYHGPVPLAPPAADHDASSGPGPEPYQYRHTEPEFVAPRLLWR